jgi:hypothetical protein
MAINIKWEVELTKPLKPLSDYSIKSLALFRINAFHIADDATHSQQAEAQKLRDDITKELMNRN